MKIKYKIYDTTRPFKKPEYSSDFAIGMDVYSSNKTNIILNPGEIQLIDTNLSIEIPENYECQVRSKSGLAAKYGVFVVNSPGLVDPDYRGEVKVILGNIGTKPFFIEPFTKVAQLVLNETTHMELEEVDELSSTERGTGGFGSTGLK